MRRIIFFVITIIMMYGVVPCAHASDVVALDICNGSISIMELEDGTTKYIQNGVETKSGTNFIIRQSDTSSPTENVINIYGNKSTINITITGINIESGISPIRVYGSLNLTLVGENIVKVQDVYEYNYYAGICVGTEDEIIISGTGALFASGGRGGAGIGGANGGVYNTNAGNITITGGTVNAIGGELAAGIGGGAKGSSGNITITGGTVSATGNEGGAGIGGGFRGSAGNITITGGTVNANGYDLGTGIGGGYEGNGGVVYIENAKLNVTGCYNAIGGASLSNSYGCDSITVINSDIVTRTKFGVSYQEKIFNPTVNNKGDSGLMNSIVVLTTNASGASGLTYQWQKSDDNSSWFNINGETSDALNIRMTEENDGCYFRCKLTNGYGNIVYTDSTQCFILEFVNQPQNIASNIGEMSIFEATSSCSNVLYQWQKSNDNGFSFEDIDSEIYNTLIINTDLSDNGNLYRCVITADNGDSLVSDAAMLTINNVSPYTKTAVSSDKKTFLINPLGVETGNIVILALYKDNKFINLYHTIYKGEIVPFTVTEIYDTAKVMVWNNFSTLMPIADVEEIK